MGKKQPHNQPNLLCVIIPRPSIAQGLLVQFSDEDCSISSTSRLSSTRARNFCLAYSCGNGNFSRITFIRTHALSSGHITRTPLTRFASRWAISLWQSLCFAVGHGNKLMREHNSDNCGFSCSQLVSICRSSIVFSCSNYKIKILAREYRKKY